MTGLEFESKNHGVERAAYFVKNEAAKVQKLGFGRRRIHWATYLDDFLPPEPLFTGIIISAVHRNHKLRQDNVNGHIHLNSR